MLWGGQWCSEERSSTNSKLSCFSILKKSITSNSPHEAWLYGSRWPLVMDNILSKSFRIDEIIKFILLNPLPALSLHSWHHTNAQSVKTFSKVSVCRCSGHSITLPSPTTLCSTRGSPCPQASLLQHPRTFRDADPQSPGLGRTLDLESGNLDSHALLHELFESLAHPRQP